VLLLSFALTACMIGDDPAATGALGARADDVGADALRWDSFASNCVSPRHGIVSIGGDLSLLFDQGAKWTECSVSGVIRVPADIKLTSVYQAVRTDGPSTPIQYTARLGGSAITTRSTSARTGFETTASIAAYGAQLCARQGASTRTVTFSISVSVATAGAFLDSIDWSIGAEPCP
jgi:hypothetical protein